MVRLVAVKGLLEPKNTKIKQRKTISSKPSPRQLALSVAQSYGGKRFSNKIFFQIIVSDIFSPHVFGYDETPPGNNEDNSSTPVCFYAMPLQTTFPPMHLVTMKSPW